MINFLLTFMRWSVMLHTRLAKSFDVPRIKIPVESKSSEFTAWFDPIRVARRSAVFPIWCWKSVQRREKTNGERKNKRKSPKRHRKVHRTARVSIKLESSSPLPTSKNLTFRSAPPVATIRSKGDHFTAFTSPSWQSNSRNILLGISSLKNTFGPEGIDPWNKSSRSTSLKGLGDRLTLDSRAASASSRFISSFFFLEKNDPNLSSSKRSKQHIRESGKKRC